MARRRPDPLLLELIALLPPGVDVVALPAEDTGAATAPAGAAAGELRSVIVERLDEAWRLLFGDADDPPAVDVRWVRTTTEDGPMTHVSASAARRATITPETLDDWVIALGGAGWLAERRDRGDVPRLVASKLATALEVQVRRSTGTVAVRALSASVPADAGGAPTA